MIWQAERLGEEVNKAMTANEKANERARLPYDAMVADARWIGVIENIAPVDRAEAVAKKAEVISHGK